MKNLLFMKAAVVLFLLTFFYQTPVFANSSWNWLTDSPKKFLPYAILLTILIEILAVVIFGRLRRSFSLIIKLIVAIIIANVASFLVPYIYRAIELENFYSEGWKKAWDLAFTSGPFYIVLLGYLFLTIIIEVPLMYLFLKKHTSSLRVLLTVIVTANILTTIIVAIMERMMFYGQW